MTKRSEIIVACIKSLDFTNSVVWTNVLFIITCISDATDVNFVAFMISSYRTHCCDFNVSARSHETESMMSSSRLFCMKKMEKKRERKWNFEASVNLLFRSISPTQSINCCYSLKLRNRKNGTALFVAFLTKKYFLKNFSLLCWKEKEFISINIEYSHHEHFFRRNKFINLKRKTCNCSHPNELFFNNNQIYRMTKPLI